MSIYIEFSDHSHELKYRQKKGLLYYIGEPDQALVKELGLRKNAKFRDGSGVEYESSLPEITAKGWELAFVLPCGAYTTSGLREMTIIENTYIFKKKQ